MLGNRFDGKALGYFTVGTPDSFSTIVSSEKSFNSIGAKSSEVPFRGPRLLVRQDTDIAERQERYTNALGLHGSSNIGIHRTVERGELTKTRRHEWLRSLLCRPPQLCSPTRRMTAKSNCGAFPCIPTNQYYGRHRSDACFPR